MNAPLSPGSNASGRNATMLITVANRIACRSRHGPSHAPASRPRPLAYSRLIASEATTGSSTSMPSAMISAAIEI
jgi:hypothetical protein